MTWEELTIRLPLPPSNNDLLRPALGGPGWNRKIRLVSTAEATSFRRRAVQALVDFARENGFPPRLTGPVLITARFYVATLASDCNNRWKALEDAITAAGVIWNDDKQVSRGISDKQFTASGADPFCLVQVAPWLSPEHALRLGTAAKRFASSHRGARGPRIAPNWRPAP